MINALKMSCLLSILMRTIRKNLNERLLHLKLLLGPLINMIVKFLDITNKFFQDLHKQKMYFKLLSHFKVKYRYIFSNILREF